jgi:cytochrome c peroxidase
MLIFEKAFGSGDAVTADNTVKAIAAFERTLVTPDSPYDRYVDGDKAWIGGEHGTCD